MIGETIEQINAYELIKPIKPSNVDLSDRYKPSQTKNSHLVYIYLQVWQEIRGLSSSKETIREFIRALAVDCYNEKNIKKYHKSTQKCCVLFNWYLISRVLEVFQPNGFIWISITHKSEKKMNEWIMIEWKVTWPPMNYLTLNIEDETRRHNK